MSEAKISVQEIYAVLSNWTSMSLFESLMQTYFSSDRSESEKAAYRAKEGNMKRLRDEVVPMLHYLRWSGFSGEVLFKFDNHFPDAHLRTADGRTRDVEITVALGREQRERGKLLNERGYGSGFVGLQDGESSVTYVETLEGEQRMYSTEHAQLAVKNGIQARLIKKNKEKYRGCDLLIEAPLSALPETRWHPVIEELRQIASDSPFDNIYVVGEQGSELVGFKVK